MLKTPDFLRMIQSVQRALGLLTLIANAGDSGLSLTELSERSGLKAPTTHNMLSTLEDCGYIARLPDHRRYVLGPMALQMGRRHEDAKRLATIVQTPLRELNQELGETVIVTLFQNYRRRTIIALESKHPLRVGGDIGDDDRLYDTATGRMMLAMAPKDDVATVIDNLGLPGKRWPEASSKTELQKLLSAIRQDGFVLYTTSGGQVIALAVPLKLVDGPPAAIGINFPASRHANVDYRAAFGERMAATARKIESNW